MSQGRQRKGKCGAFVRVVGVGFVAGRGVDGVVWLHWVKRMGVGGEGVNLWVWLGIVGDVLACWS